MHVADSWQKAIEYMGAVFLDLAKAFDCIDHNTCISISKLPFYGIHDGALIWIKNYLTN